MIERFIIWSGFLFGILSFPTLFKKPSYKIWLPLYLINCIINYIFNAVLVRTKKLKYPVRAVPKIFKINSTYDFFVCPFLSVWYCQSIYNSKLPGIIGKLFLFSLPQGAYEVFLEKKTNLLKFKGNWNWYHSVFLVFIVKIISIGTLKILKTILKPVKT
ncbi:CBO0543 family protein [Bacillus carboniphilus]|uniref:CBO0543 family protein n=1 Tax=Bacillus carboniphilus TaxID=86663 RepID=UPI003CD0B65B